MEEMQIIAMLLQHADEEIRASANFFFMLVGIVATMTMTKAYDEKFNWFLKLLLSVGLSILLWNNRDGIIEQMVIYNALIDTAGTFDEPWKTLFGSHSFYVHQSAGLLWFVHAMGSLMVHLLIWHKEIRDHIGRRVAIWWRNRKSRRKQLTGKK